MAQWASFGFQDGASPSQEQLIYFHDHAMISLVIIMTMVTYYLSTSFYNSYTHYTLTHGQLLEFVWTGGPCIILMFIALPSLRLLYLLDEAGAPSVTIKSVGHQWYWSYEYSDFGGVDFDSYMVPSEETPKGGLRLLDVDNRVVVPYSLDLRVLVSSADVLHSWALPSLGVKVDAVPGRLNQVNFSCLRPGLYFGQCSEICGANHSFMPIVLEGVDPYSFVSWMRKQD
uniref:Cytochrome c oxidase subunit 2 n=1 Tax=Portunion sp. TaxID=2932407 RepID=A0A977TPQ8_9CRUS|nr:cytochrome c oxidase subunit 2 [Portunion sp.]